ncbi:fungal specific transcription factor domain-containing protein [Aspergillus mulundensis]|uniref:Putative Zn(II)2Cys6 transcription factor n=1 Tax=Aspergillus mulundensis TaxID=1810919 RepID=A0A3D8SJP7_9EURO|nr:putative Zn(II)2Cys6 transcription factor [Aspergillus mulundensis]RDW86414.1 putative Zn(II)2Cys6 transcription factor [Aspergillus mulundensis]
MERPSGRPQSDAGGQGGEHLLQPQSNSHPNIVPVSNPPSLSGSSLQIPRGPPRSAITTGKKHMSKVAIPRQRSGTAPRYSRRVPLAQISQLSAKSNDYENLLREMSQFVDGRMSERIKNTLDKYSDSGTERFNDQQSTNSAPASGVEEELDPEMESLPSSIGSLEAIDRVDEDLNRSSNARATGYMGKNSEVTWLQRLGREAGHRARNLSGMADSRPDRELSIHSVNYHLDDVDITPPGPVHLYWMPPRNIADKLFEDYLDTIHPVFPIISRPLFSAQYRNFFDNSARPGDKWLAILNLIFAISSCHAHLMQASWRGDDRDHFVYLARARALSMNSDTLFTHPDLQQVQVEALTAFYLLATSQINRAWRIASLALRSGISLGLNLRNTSEITPDISKEARYRVWWCLFTFEHILGTMTGRMTGISDGICTTPMPLPVDEDRFHDPAVVELLSNLELRQERIEAALASCCVRQMPQNPRRRRETNDAGKSADVARLKSLPPSTALFFLCYVDLAVISQEIVNRVYSLDCIMTPWGEIENRISELRSRVECWHSNLPEAYDWGRSDEQNPVLLRASLCLAFYYYSVRITLGRPCLCRRDVRPTNSPGQKKPFSHEISISVLESARQLISLIPDVPDASRIYQLCPWWCILHYLMQATTVLLLEISFGSIHVPEEEKNIIKAAKKGIRWLYAMSESSLASRRAWELCDRNLRQLAAAAGSNIDLSDMPVGDYQFDTNGIQPNHSQQPQANPRPPITTTVTQLPTLASTPTFQYISPLSNNPQEQNPLSQCQTTSSALQQPPIAPLLPSTHPDDPLSYPFDATTSAGASNDVYFPYDPITGEFIRSFFPNSNEEEPWEG